MTSAPGTRTRHSNKLLFSLVQPPKLLRKHDKAWTHSTSQLQSHFSKSQPSASPGPVPSLISSPARPPCQVCQSRFQEYFSVTYVTLVGIWTASSSPSQTSLLGHGNVPCATLLPPHPRVHCDTSASSLPSETLTLTKHHLEKEKKDPPITCQYKERGVADISGRKNNKIPRMRRWCAHDEGSGFKLQVWYRDSPCEGLETWTQTVFSVFFFSGGCVLADRSHPSSRVASISASCSCRDHYT